MRIRVRLGAGLSRFADAPQLSIDLAEGANGLARAAELLDMTLPEVMNRATVTGAIEIGRHPGVVQVTFRAPAGRLEARGLLTYAQELYPQ